VKNISFGLLELEMANLEHFFEKNTLGPLGVNLCFYANKRIVELA
jgi:hypothetical protein